MKRSRTLALTAAALAVGAAVPALAATSKPAPLSLLNAVPSWVSTSQLLSRVDGASKVDIAVVLNYRDAAGLKAFDADVSNPASKDFRKFLTTAEFNSRFGVDKAQVSTVTSWLKKSGFTVDGTSGSGIAVTAHGSAALVESVLHTTLGIFKVAGDTVRAPMTAPTLPAKLAGIVSAIQGLDTVAYKPTNTVADNPDATPPAAFLNARPCSTYWNETATKGLPAYKGKNLDVNTCGYTPTQIRDAYGFNKIKQTGKGATIGIIDAWASPTIVSDVNTYSARHGLPAFTKGQFTQALPQPVIQDTPELPEGGLLGIADPQGWSAEETLDVEAEHTFAPGANITYIPAVSPLNETLDLAVLETVEQSLAQVVSNSYGSTSEDTSPADLAIFNSAMSQAAAKGITFSYSAGDSGDNTFASGARTIGDPANSDMVTTLGATSLFIGKSNNYLGEGYWGTKRYNLTANGKAWDFSKVISFAGGGGGVSTVYAEPSYQKGVVPNSLATYGGVKPGRVIPDLSIDGDSTTGFLIGQTQTTAGGQTGYSEYRIGGTSVSSPLFSGLLADAIQANGGKSLGMINPVLYAGAKSGAFRDVTAPKATVAAVRYDYADPADPTTKVTPSLRVLGNLETLHLLKGYDDATGLGSPVAGPFVTLLSKH